MLRRFCQDDGGGIISPEMAIVGALLVVGLVVGLVALRTGLEGEIHDLGEVVETVDFTPTVIPLDPQSSLSSQSGSNQPGFPQTVADLNLE